MLAGARRSEAPDQSVRNGIARVARHPRFQCALLPFQIASDVAIVQRFDVEALAVADPIAQLVGPAYALSRQRRLSHDAVAESDEHVADRKIGINRNRAL